jgi:hypothetical protein
MTLADVGDVLGSPVWTVLATLFTAAAIGVTVWLYRRQQERKSLSYERQITSLVSVHASAKGSIRILFGDEEVERAHLVEVKLKNTGNVPILDEDFERPISFDLGRGATAMSVDVVDVEPAELCPEVRVESNEAHLMPLLLNPGDQLALKMLVRNLNGSVTCHYRIVGISKLTDEGAQLRQQRPPQRRRERQRFRQRPSASWRWLRRERMATAISAAVAILGLLAAFTSIALFRERDHSQVTLKNGDQLCGKILDTNTERIVIQLDSGGIRPVQLNEVQALRDRAC